MILARNADAFRYKGIHPNLDLALDLLTDEALSRLGPERILFRGEDVYGTAFTYDTVPDDGSALFEAHWKYLDIHVLLSGRETVEVAGPDELETVEERPEGDIRFLRGSGRRLTLSPGEFLAVFPGDAHKLKLAAQGPETVTKGVYKVRISE